MADRAVLGGRPARQAVAPDPRSAPGVFLSQRRLLLSLRPHADPDEDPERVRGRVLVPVSLPAGARAVRRERRAPGDDAVRLLPFPDPLVGPEHPRRVGRVPDPLHVGQEPAAGALLLPPRARPTSSGRLRARELPRLPLLRGGPAARGRCPHRAARPPGPQLRHRRSRRPGGDRPGAAGRGEEEDRFPDEPRGSQPDPAGDGHGRERLPRPSGRLDAGQGAGLPADRRRLLLVLPLPVGHHLGAEGVLAAGDDPDLPPDAGGGAGRRVLRAGPFSRLLPGAAPHGAPHRLLRAGGGQRRHALPASGPGARLLPHVRGRGKRAARAAATRRLRGLVIRVLALLPYPTGRAPGQRYRIEQWAPRLRTEGVELSLAPFLSPSGMDVLYHRGRAASKVRDTLRGYLRRGRDLTRPGAHDVIYVYREAAPLGPAWIEALLARRRP